ncbi:MAG: rRNA maturation RNase YbeY [Candidatus Omnitrophica bacterium]|nr:rRNA maturation RNase YbeY [Candidatus Omnitrophota bacterium]
MKISVRNRQNILRINVLFIKRLVRYVLKEEQAAEKGEISLCVTDDPGIRRLNKAYLGKDCPTDVLSFDLSDEKAGLYADIIVSTETACAYSRKFRTDPAYELHLYLVHGILHILGYDDRTKKERDRMHKRELQLLKTFVFR